jgi:hypothetical protein
MAPDPRCTALAAAKDKKGAIYMYLVGHWLSFIVDIGISYTQIAEKMGTSEQHVIDSMSLDDRLCLPMLT